MGGRAGAFGAGIWLVSDWPAANFRSGMSGCSLSGQIADAGVKPASAGARGSGRFCAFIRLAAGEVNRSVVFS
jgi:hypothetical protein